MHPLNELPVPLVLLQRLEVRLLRKTRLMQSQTLVRLLALRPHKLQPSHRVVMVPCSSPSGFSHRLDSPTRRLGFPV